jgi:hypothetical protein
MCQQQAGFQPGTVDAGAAQPFCGVVQRCVDGGRGYAA